jgi:GT2 family glycosyltransferase
LISSIHISTHQGVSQLDAVSSGIIKEQQEYPLVTIVVLNYNGLAFIRKCLSSVMELDYPSYEVLFVDNASTDGSVDEVKTNFPKVKIIENSADLGFAAGMNVGLRYSAGSLIALLSIDTAVQPTWLKALVKQVMKDSLIGACGGKIWTLSNGHYRMGSHDGLKVDKKLRMLEVPQEVSAICGSAFLVNKHVVESVGMLDEKYFMYFEEVDWCWRMRLAGYKCMYVPQAVSWHKGGHSEVPSRSKIYFNSRNWLQSILKNCELKSIIFYSSFLFLKYLLALSQCFSFRKDKRLEGTIRLFEYSHSVFWVIRGLKDIIEEWRLKK